MRRPAVALSAVLAAAAILGGCGGARSSAPLAAAAAAYVKAHPAPVRAGMVAGIITTWTDEATDQYNAWQVSVVTAGGNTLTVRCGTPTLTGACTWRGPGNVGDYMYFPASGRVPANWVPGAVVMIRRGAVR